eukprot:6183998-Pleurochrysis_carterae.AAC.11
MTGATRSVATASDVSCEQWIHLIGELRLGTRVLVLAYSGKCFDMHLLLPPQASVLAPLLQTRSADDARTLCERLSSALVSTSTRVIDVFHEWDYDDDGVINHADFAAAMKQLGLDADVEGTAQLFETLDREQLGVITFENLRRGLRPPPGASRPRKVGTRARAVAGEGARKGGGCDGGGGGGGGGGEGAPLVPVAAQKPDPLTQSLLDTMKKDNADQVLRGVLLLNATKLAHVLKAMVRKADDARSVWMRALLSACMRRFALAPATQLGGKLAPMC